MTRTTSAGLAGPGLAPICGCEGLQRHDDRFMVVAQELEQDAAALLAAEAGVKDALVAREEPLSDADGLAGGEGRRCGLWIRELVADGFYHAVGHAGRVTTKGDHAERARQPLGPREVNALLGRLEEKVAGKKRFHPACARIDRIHLAARAEGMETALSQLPGNDKFLEGFDAQHEPEVNGAMCGHSTLVYSSDPIRFGCALIRPLALLLNEPLLPPLVPLIHACGNGWKKFVNTILTFSVYPFFTGNSRFGGSAVRKSQGRSESCVNAGHRSSITPP